MARVEYGALVTGLHGAVGGTVFQGSSKGNIARNKGIQQLLLSERQQAAKRHMLEVTQLWSASAQAVRDDYNTFAATYPQYDRKTGTRQLSGYEVWLMYNLFLLSVGLPIKTSIDIQALVLPTINPIVANTAGNFFLDIQDSASEPDARWAIFMSRPLRGGITNPGSQLRFVVFMPTDLGPTDIGIYYVNVFGTLPVDGDIIFISAKPFGYVSPYIYARQLFRCVVL